MAKSLSSKQTSDKFKGGKTPTGTKPVSKAKQPKSTGKLKASLKKK